MKRFSLFLYLLMFIASWGFGQSKSRIIDDIYVSPNDAQMVQEVEAAKRTVNQQKTVQQKPVYKNGAKEIIFIDQNGNRTNMVSDTVYVIDNAAIDSLENDSLYNQNGYYLNGFNGTQSDLEYAERIRRFHNPKYTIYLGDPRYNDIYFLDNSYWNVYLDNSYAYVTPTWINPYWWDYNFSPFSYGWGNSWYSPYGMGYYPWYSSYGFGGWGGYPYYGWGGYYGGGYFGGGWGYPYGGYYGGGYGYPYYGGGYGSYNRNSQNVRRENSSARYDVNAAGNTNINRRSSAIASGRSSVGENSYTTVSRQSTGRSSVGSAMNGQRTSTNGRYNSDSRSAYSRGVNTQTRTGTVRSTEQWNSTRDNSTRSNSSYNSSTYNSGRSSSVINHTSTNENAGSSRSSGNYNSGRSTSTGSSSRTPSYETTSRSSGDSYSSGRSSNYSSGGGSSSSGSSSGGGRSSSSSSSSSGGGRR